MEDEKKIKTGKKTTIWFGGKQFILDKEDFERLFELIFLDRGHEFEPRKKFDS